MNTPKFRFAAALLVAATMFTLVIFGRLTSEREAEIRAVRDAYYAGLLDKERARAMVGDVVENWHEPWGPQ